MISKPIRKECRDKYANNNLELSDKDKHAIAWIYAFIALFKAAIIIVVFIVLCGLLYSLVNLIAGTNFFDYLYKFVLDNILIITGLVFLYIILSFIKNDIYENMFGRVIPGWNLNKGIKPDEERVNVQFNDGSIAWNISPNNLDWSLDKDLFIREYMVKRTSARFKR